MYFDLCGDNDPIYFEQEYDSLKILRPDDLKLLEA